MKGQDDEKARRGDKMHTPLLLRDLKRIDDELRYIMYQLMDAYFRVGIWLCDEVDTEQLRAQIEDYIEHLDGVGLAEVEVLENARK